MSIEDIIQYRFKNSRLLKEALTHPNCGETIENTPFNYQRLEFLGDAVLGTVAAELLMQLFPLENEGSLAKRHAALVKTETLAGVARALGFGAHIRMMAGTRQAERDLNSNLENVCEALIGAVYLDGGFERARDFIRRHWERPARAMTAPPKDAKTTLQEWGQAKGLPLPEYRIVEITGPSHAPEFTISVALEGAEPVMAKAASKRQAEQMAAKMLMEKLHD